MCQDTKIISVRKPASRASRTRAESGQAKPVLGSIVCIVKNNTIILISIYWVDFPPYAEGAIAHHPLYASGSALNGERNLEFD
jgi:hypothetical protein